ncbi:MAG: PKD domain-containing protein [bacterium]|nr:PKD domain-containing protein [bacterium]
MKRAQLILLPAVLLVFLAIAGCNDESQPKFTRIRVYPDCGIAPMNVEGLAIVSGGNESGDPTGGNNNLEITWDFGDGGSSNTSIAYHTFTLPGEYNIVATATDPDGQTDSISQMVTVMADSLDINTSTNFLGNAATTNDTVRFDLRAESCGIDPDVDGDYRNLVFTWHMNDGTDTIMTSHRPHYQFPASGIYDVIVDVTYPAGAITRHDTLRLDISDPVK